LQAKGRRLIWEMTEKKALWGLIRCVKADGVTLTSLHKEKERAKKSRATCRISRRKRGEARTAIGKTWSRVF